MNDPTAPTPAQRPLAVLGWAAFLACSWTWCIGMFLPVLLVRDFGTWAWVIFALPNVVGAAAMGWVLQRPGASERLVGRHAGAMTAFSVVTILFHVLFVGWVVWWLGGVAGVGGQAVVVAAAGAAVVGFPLLLSRRVAIALAAVMWAGSVAAFAVAGREMGRIPPVPEGSAGWADLLPLALVCVLGFVLCPYLDLTFHRARQATSTFGAIAAFTIGFGALFLVMIVFTLWYAPLAIPPEAGGSTQPLPAAVALAIAGHMVGQSGFTAAAHGVEVFRRLRAGLRPPRWGALAGFLFGAGVLAAAWVLRDRGGYPGYYGTARLSGEELGYRLFLSFYGLVAPAYVWVVLTPWRGGRATDKQRWATFAVAVLLAAPAYWVGFVERQMAWLSAGVAVVVLARPAVEYVFARRAGSARS